MIEKLVCEECGKIIKQLTYEKYDGCCKKCYAKERKYPDDCHDPRECIKGTVWDYDGAKQQCKPFNYGYKLHLTKSRHL